MTREHRIWSLKRPTLPTTHKGWVTYAGGSHTLMWECALTQHILEHAKDHSSRRKNGRQGHWNASRLSSTDVMGEDSPGVMHLAYITDSDGDLLEIL